MYALPEVLAITRTIADNFPIDQPAGDLNEGVSALAEAEALISPFGARWHVAGNSLASLQVGDRFVTSVGGLGDAWILEGGHDAVAIDLVLLLARFVLQLTSRYAVGFVS